MSKSYVSMRVAKREIIEDRGDYVVVSETLEPHPNGPFVVLIEDGDVVRAVHQIWQPTPSEDNG